MPNGGTSDLLVPVGDAQPTLPTAPHLNWTRFRPSRKMKVAKDIAEPRFHTEMRLMKGLLVH